MKGVAIILYRSNTLKDGGNPVYLRITKNRQRKYISLDLSATPQQWNDDSSRYKRDKRIYPNYEADNAFLNLQEAKALEIIQEFEFEKYDWTLNQFEDAFLHRAKKGKVKSYIENLIKTQKDTNHIGNSNSYSSALRMLKHFDKKFETRIFSEIDIKYVRAFDSWLQIPRESTYISKKGKTKIVPRNGCCGNTRKFYLKALRTILNRAIKDKEASVSTYPFGKGGFEVEKLEEETSKRYLPSEYLKKVKITTSSDDMCEYARKLFLFSYFGYGMSFVDMAHLKTSNLRRYEDGLYIEYKRHKTVNSKRAHSLRVKLTDVLEGLVADLCGMKKPVGDYLLPIVSKEGLAGEILYNHIRGRFHKYNGYLARLADELGISDINLTSYVSRHTMAMTLQNSNIPREIISQILGHKDLETTNTYLDSFNSNVIDEAVKVL